MTMAMTEMRSGITFLIREGSRDWKDPGEQLNGSLHQP